jgi:hypothetical protein
MDIDQMCEEELQALNNRINTTDSISLDIKNLIKDTYSVRASLDSAQEYSNRKQYVNAYKALLNSMSQLININKEILEKYSTLSNVMKDNHGSQTQD